LSTKIEQLDWRRSKVVELRVRGLSQTEIAHELQVSKASISLDMQYLRNQAKESIKEYVTEHLPEQYQICLSALDTILKHTFEILQTSHDNREKLQAMEVFKDTHLVKLELLSNATTIIHLTGTKEIYFLLINIACTRAQVLKYCSRSTSAISPGCFGFHSRSSRVF
jgi:hypothetical protein